MKRILLILIAISMLVSVPAVFGQSREITEAELTKLIAEAIEKRKGLPQRQKISTVGYNKGDSSETLYEFGPNDTYHYRSIKKTNGVESKTEGIRLGKVRYTRQPDGSWIKEPPSGIGIGIGTGIGSGSGSGTGSSMKPETATQYEYVGSEKISSHRTARYRKTHIVKFIDRTPVLTRKIVDDYWFNADGLLVKESREDWFVESNRSYKRTTEYEYDNNIKITAPIPD